MPGFPFSFPEAVSPKTSVATFVKVWRPFPATRSFGLLREEGVMVDRSRMDAGSYAEEIVKVVDENSRLFYILTNDHASTEKEVIGYYNGRGASEKTFDIFIAKVSKVEFAKIGQVFFISRPPSF